MAARSQATCGYGSKVGYDRKHKKWIKSSKTEKSVGKPPSSGMIPFRSFDAFGTQQSCTILRKLLDVPKFPNNSCPGSQHATSCDSNNFISILQHTHAAHASISTITQLSYLLIAMKYYDINNCMLMTQLIFICRYHLIKRSFPNIGSSKQRAYPRSCPMERLASHTIARSFIMKRRKAVLLTNLVLVDDVDDVGCS